MIKIDNGLIVNDIYVPRPSTLVKAIKTQEFKDFNVTENGFYVITPDEGFGKMKQVNLNVDVQANVNLAPLSVTVSENEQSFNANEQGLDGFDSVTVDATEYGNNRYSDGYDNGVIDSTQGASVVDVIDNGTVYTKYSDNIPEFNEPLTGDDFYSYAKVNYACFDTGVKFNELTDLEFWYRFTDDFGTAGVFFGYNNSSAFKIEKDSDSYANLEGYRFSIKWGRDTYYVYLKKDEWHNFKWSENNLIVDGTFVTYLQNNLTSDKTIWFNGNTEDTYNNQESGEYGMVKINGRVIVPDGYSFKWQDNDEYLPFVSGSNYLYTFEKIEKPVVIDGLIKEVNIETKVDVGNFNLLPWRETKMQKIPEVFDFSNVKSFANAFYANKGLTDISALRTVTKPVYTIDNMFTSSSKVFDLSPLENWDVSECLDAKFCFSNCQITDYSPLAKWNLSKCTSMSSFIQINGYTTPDIIKIPAIRCDSVGGLNQGIVRFNSDSAKCPVIEMGGFINIKTSLTQSDGIAMCPNLTYDSCINILNGLYDFTGHSETPTSSQGTLKVHQNFLDLVGDEINIAISKGWNITA